MLRSARSRIRLVAEGVGPLADDPEAVRIAADGALPAPDNSLDRIDAGALVASIAATSLPALFAGIRRALRPGGVLDCRGPRAPTIARVAALVGLESEDEGEGTFRKPDRRLDGDPLVSIVVPALSPRFFATALASALGQTWPHLEIVVCDDSAGDEIAAIVRAASRERPIRHLRNPRRLGTRANLARGLAEARGEFVKFLNDDDVLHPECVLTLLDAFRTLPDIVLATSRRQRIDEHGVALTDQPATRPVAERDLEIAGLTLANAMLCAGLNIVGEPTTVMFRRRDFTDRGDDPFAFDGVPARGAVDMAMWATLLARGNAVWFARPLSDFRIHAGQSQQDAGKRARAVDGIRSLQQAWLALGLAPPSRATEILARPYPATSGDAWQWHRVPALEDIARRMRAGSDAWRYGAPRFLGAG